MSTANWSPGQVLTATALNAMFNSKLDAANPTMTGTFTATGPVNLNQTSGRTLIGNATDDTKTQLQVAGAASTNGGLQTTGGSTNYTGAGGVEIDYNLGGSGVGSVTCYDRTNLVYKSLIMRGLDIRWQANGTEFMRLSQGGRLLINTTTDNGTDKVQVNGTIKSLSGGFVFPDGSSQTTAAPNGIGSAWVVKSANYTAVNYDKLMCDTSAGGFTVTLPASPGTGVTVQILDAAGKFATNNLTINPGSATIMGTSGNMTVSTNNLSFALVYTGTDWRIA